MEPKSKILLVEDDRELSLGLIDALRLEGYSVSSAEDGLTGLREAVSGDHDLVVLDAMLPRLSGFDLLQRLRHQGCTIPVLMLTARSQEVDKVRGLRMGADDYLTKPFGVMELLARIAALLRRTRPSVPSPRRLEFEDVIVDFRARMARRGPLKIRLTAREFEILEALAQHRGEAVSRSDLIARIWGIDDDVDVSTRTVDQHIASLRRKLESDPSSPTTIRTVYGYGYRLS